MSIRTIKLPIKIDSEESENKILALQKMYNSAVKFAYNRLFENKELKMSELNDMQQDMNNCEIGSWLLSCSRKEAKQIIEAQADIAKQIVFGGKKLFFLRNKLKINKSEFQEKKLLPLYSIGEQNQNSNRLFQITSSSSILFKPDRHTKIYLQLPKLRGNLAKDLEKLQFLQGTLPISYKLSKTHIYISFENNVLYQMDYQKVENRVLSIDLNPNYLGWSVIDWKGEDEFTIIDKGLISIKDINDKHFALNKLKDVSPEDKRRVYLNNKRNHEVVHIADFLVNTAKHYGCQIFSMEDLNMKSNDKQMGRRYNSLVNNLWNRNLMVNQIVKRCNLNCISVSRVAATFSSFMGNLVYRDFNLPDAVLSSIEIGRRGFEFHNQYVTKKRNKKNNIIFNSSPFSLKKISQSLEELGFSEIWSDLRGLYYLLKTRKFRYRVQLEEVPVVCSVFDTRKLIRFNKYL